MNKAVVHQLPKVELHCHLDGSVPMDTLRVLAEDKGIPKERMYKAVAPKDCQDLKDYLSCFDVILSVLQTKEQLERATYAVIEEAAKENVTYLELRFAPLLHMKEGLTLKEVIEAVCKGVEKAAGKFPTDVNILICALRHHQEKDNARLFDSVSKIESDYVVGVDIAGDEANFPNEIVSSVVKQAKDTGMNITFHSGECGCAHNVLSAIHMGATRIGHGVAVKDDQAIIDEVKERNILLELCPTSNIQTKAVNGWSDYPLRIFLDQDVPVSINTDNRTVSNTTLTDELMLCIEQCQMTLEEIKKMSIRAMQHSFAKDSVKNEQINIIENSFDSLIR